mmetsp:Transcript_28246/g.41731  ORF Transcript_28246/g.41731 Transcript_28246/m.41731 type:complete len:453 (-) Transcript_28246:1285-2643(-)|eukprot:CAMPEP_0194200332 /NCGR_PEP_ID=MMETSP0156-20130528/979_1 /TAXON_ID=33649 /ORGANISM="Thalassionema nitzschioides, Strain L26-B" /LENGTH=452 /DNA_ID=CAMNT_0038925313 /DNA_START=63 /DNA_END=1421 /DNA_ORIENTATION=+
MEMALDSTYNPEPFDLEAYIARYQVTSETRLQRLLFVAKNTTDYDVSREAYRMAERQLLENSNVRCYKDVFGDSTQKSGIAYDSAWVEETEIATQTSMETLEGRLSAAQAHLQKEAIRMAYLAIGEFSRQRGDLQQALRAVMRSRDYCTSRNQTGHVCLLVIELAMDTKNYQQVHDYVAKAEHSAIPGDNAFPLKLKVASGVAHLAEGRFKEAALQLTNIPVGDEYTAIGSSIASSEDVALYGTLSGLATLKRSQLQRLLETQANGFLDLVSPLRNALQLYCRADYPGCLRILNQLYPNLKLDMILSPFLDKLFENILQKSCIEYLKPYRKVDLVKMASIFSLTVDKLTSTLADLIGSGHIPYAQIDCLTHTLECESSVSLKHRQRDTKKKILAMEQNILNDTYAMMIRVSCMENDNNDRRKQSFVEYMDSDDDDRRVEPMEVAAGNPEDLY